MKCSLAHSLTIAATVGSVFAATPVLAASITYSSYFVPSSNTTIALDAMDNFTGGITDAEVRSGGYGFTDIKDSLISVQKFDSSLGNLKSVTLAFYTDIWQKTYYEQRGNLPAAGRDVKFDFTLDLSLKSSADGTSIFNEALATSHQFKVYKYDGKTDYAGTSGGIFNTGLSGKYQQSMSFTDTAALNSFIGTGTLDYLFSALALTKMTGTGNMSMGVMTLAKAGIQVNYEYEKRSIPEPSSLIGLMIAAALTGALSRRKAMTTGNS